MFPSFIIAFRESLEAALIAAAVISYLAKTERRRLLPVAYGALLAGLLASAAGIASLERFWPDLSGTPGRIFTGITQIIGGLFLLATLLWLNRGRNQVERRVEKYLAWAGGAGIFLALFISVLRDGFEAMIFLKAASYAGSASLYHWLGAAGGVIGAAALGSLLVLGTKKIPVKQFFAATNVLLIIYSVWLIIQGVYQFYGAGLAGGPYSKF